MSLFHLVDEFNLDSSEIFINIHPQVFVGNFGRQMMQLTDLENSTRFGLTRCAPISTGSECPQTEQPAQSAFDLLNYVYGAMAANSFVELECLH